MIANDRHDWGCHFPICQNCDETETITYKETFIRSQNYFYGTPKGRFHLIFFKKQKQTMVGCYRSFQDTKEEQEHSRKIGPIFRP